MNKNIGKMLGVLLFFTLSLQACSSLTPKAPPATPEPVHLKVLVQPYMGYAPFYIAQDEGYFAEQGLDVEFVRLDRAADALVSLAQGQLDVSAGTIEIGMFNAIAKGTKIKFVADKGFMDPNGCNYAAWMTRKELLDSGKLNDLKNLAGLKAFFGAAGAEEYFFDILAKGAGLTSADVQSSDPDPQTRMEGLQNGAVDIGLYYEPWITRTQNAGGVIWKPVRQYLPNFPLSVIVYGPNLLEKNPEAGKRFMVAFLKAVQQYNQGKTDRNVEIIAKNTQLKPEDVKSFCWQSIKPDGSVDIQQIQDFQNWAIAKGYLDKGVTNDQLWDGQFIDYANKTLQASKP